MTVSIDVCGAMEILLQKEKSEMFSKVLEEATFVVTSDLYVSELTNTLWKYHKAKALSKDACIECIHNGINFIDRFIDSRDLWREAFSEGINNNHSIYDMFYLVIARRYDATLVTNDFVLSKIGKKSKIKICY